VQIIFEDNHIIAVNKSCGEIVQGDKTGDLTLIDAVKDYLKKKYSKSGNVYIGLPHRLDRPTSGVVLLAKTEKALIRLNKMFQAHNAVEKTYWAVIDNRPPKFEDTLEHYLVKNQEKNISMAFRNQRSDGKYASLTYRHIASSDRYHLLEIELHTGRHHQVRVQLRQINLHIKGDVKYGFPRANDDKGIHLHARKVEFEHPVKKEHVTIIANPPNEVLWNEFMNLLQNNRFNPVYQV
jgi:23S rRNA pseudouridine1911/1915/1917 synthase